MFKSGFHKWFTFILSPKILRYKVEHISTSWTKLNCKLGLHVCSTMLLNT